MPFNRLIDFYAHNFCSLESVTFPVEDQRLTHIIGINNDDDLSPSNGSGKSTIKSALCWNLFGKTETGLTGDSILPWNQPRACCETGSEWKSGVDSLKVVRYRNHKTKKNMVELYLNDSDITGATGDDTQALINNYLGFNYDLFCTLLTTGLTSKKLKDFMQMTDAEKKEYVGFLLDLSFLDSAQESAKGRLKTVNVELTKHMQDFTGVAAKLEAAQENLKNYEAKVKVHAQQLEESLNRKQGNVDGMEKDLLAKRGALENLRNEIKAIIVPESPDTSCMDAKRSQIKAYHVHNSDQQIEKDRVSKELLAQNRKLGQEVVVDESVPCLVKINAELASAKRELAVKESYSTENYNDQTIEKQQKAISSDEHKIEAFKLDVKKYESETHETICPTCSQPLNPEHIEKIELQRISNLKNAQEQVESYGASLVSRRQKLEEYRKNKVSELQKINADKIEDLKAEIAQLESMYVETKKVEFERLSKERNLASIQAKISSLNAELVTIDSILSVNQKNIEKLEAEVETEEASIRGIQAKVLTLTQQKTSLKANFQALKTEYEQFKAKIDAEQAAILGLLKEKEVNPYTQFVDSVKLELTQLKERLASINKQVAELNETIAYLEFWVMGFGDKGIKSYVLDSITELLESKANFALTSITNGNTSIGFCAQKSNKDGSLRDEFTVEIYREGRSVQFLELSKGERCRVSFAVNYALKALGTYYHGLNLNFEWYDEVLDGLDEIGCYQVIQFLRHELKNYSSIFVVSHNEAVKSMFDKNLIIEKTNGVSKLRNE